MTRRNFIALVSLCVLVALGVIVVGVGVFATQSDYGQTAVRRSIERQVQSSIHGKVHIGRISGTFVTGVTIDSGASGRPGFARRRHGEDQPGIRSA